MTNLARRRFPPPWTIEEYNDACFIVRDNNGEGLGYFYVEEEAGRREAANLLTKEEARRMAVNFAKLPGAVAAKIALDEDMRTINIGRFDMGSMGKFIGHNPNGIGLANTAILRSFFDYLIMK